MPFDTSNHSGTDVPEPGRVGFKHYRNINGDIGRIKINNNISYLSDLYPSKYNR